jgi:tRNA(fMet)-specific endonuclease VapC
LTACVVDTNVASFMLDDRPELERYLGEFEPETVIYLSFQTLAELRLGALNRRWSATRQHTLQAFVDTLEVVQCTDELCHRWAQVMHEARQAGRRLEAGDGWVAATALLLDVPLLTHDRDFAESAVPSITVICHAG